MRRIIGRCMYPRQVFEIVHQFSTLTLFAMFTFISCITSCSHKLCDSCTVHVGRARDLSLPMLSGFVIDEFVGAVLAFIFRGI